MKRRIKRLNPDGRGSGQEESTSEYEEELKPLSEESASVSTIEGESEKLQQRSQKKKRKVNTNSFFLNMVIGILSVVVAVLLIAVVYLNSQRDLTPKCQFHDSDFITPRNFDDPEPFDDLTPKELQTVRDFMLAKREFKLTPFDKAWPNNSYILSIDLYLPKKAEVIEYSDKGGKKPERKALVVLVRGDSNPPGVEEYIVSPLPNPKSAELYVNPIYKRYPIPYASRPMDLVDMNPLNKIVVRRAMEKMYPLLMESFGRTFHNCTSEDDCLTVIDMAPRGHESGTRKSWIWAFAAYEGHYIHPMGLELLIDHISTDITKWHVEKVVYNGIKFNSVDDLMGAFYDKTLKMINWREKDLRYSTYGLKGDRPDSPLQGPRLFEPEGKRFRVDGQHVTYGKWNFHYRMSAYTGLQLFDVKFEGERLAYEISLQEVLVLYTGYGPANAFTKYYDRSWFLGADNFELVRGVDCPNNAIFLDSYFLANSGSTQKFKNNVCIFENNGAIPLRRHYANDFKAGYDFYGGLVDYHLIIRTVATVWNYDYIFDYIFYSNGAIECKTSATGYVQATFRLPKEEQYGSVIHHNVVAALHQHALNYKVDLDIAGVKNRYMTLDVGLETIEDPWIENSTRTQMKITRNLIERESKEGTDKSNVPQYHIFVNDQSVNKYKSKRGYRILNKDPVPFLERDQPVAKAAQWAKYPVAVTRRKDTEQYSTSMYAQHDPWTPVVDFEDYLDGESLVDEDLVAWVTIGTYHIPGTEDAPSTPTTWNQYSFFLTPHNYFTECPGVTSIDNVLIRPTKGDKSKPIIKSYGRSYESTCIPQTKGPYSYDGIRHNTELSVF